MSNDGSFPSGWQIFWCELQTLIIVILAVVVTVILVLLGTISVTFFFVTKTLPPGERGRYQSLLSSVAVRAQSLKQTEVIALQGRVYVLTIQGANRNLVQAISAAINTGRLALQTGYAVRFALETERKAIQAVRQTGEVVSQLILGNAQTMEQQSGAADELLKNGIIDMDKLAEANATLVRTLQTTEKARVEVIGAVATNVARLDQMAKDLKAVLPQEKDKAVSIEAAV